MEAAAYAASYGLMAIIMAVYYVVIPCAAALQYLALWKIFVKAGEPGWKCLIPFYSGHTMYKLFWKPVYFWLTMVFALVIGVLMVIGAMGFNPTYHYGGAPAAYNGLLLVLYLAYAVFAIVCNIKLYLGMARSFGYGGGFAAGLIFLPLIFQLILAFGRDTYKGNTYRKQAAPTQEPWTQPPKEEN